MGLDRLRRYDVQARYASVLAFLAIPPGLGAVFVAWRNYNHELGQIIYGGRGYFLPVFLGCVLLSLVPGVLGFAMGWSSAGQRRNDKPARSWLGFFVGGAVVTLDLVLLIAFMMLRFQQPG